MSLNRPLHFQHGPLTAYIKPLERCPDLQPFVRSLLPETTLVWCDSSRFHALTGRWSILGYDPWLTFQSSCDRIEMRTSRATQVWRAQPFEALRWLLRRYGTAQGALQRTDLSGGGLAEDRMGVAGRAVGLMGFLSYELNRWIERLPTPRWERSDHQPPTGDLAEGWPDMVWFGMRVVVLLDHLAQRGWLISVADPHGPQPLARRDALEALQQAEERLGGEVRSGETKIEPQSSGTSSLRATSTQEAFEAMVSRALDLIREGEIFQANLSQRFTASRGDPPFRLYQRLRRLNPSPFSCFLSWGSRAVASCSPERLVRVQEGRIEARPIAGTRPRGLTATEDALQSLDLFMSEKERAEHIMLVDLARNDLGRVCAMGSVGVNELMSVESYSHVIHLVSEVSGMLRDGVDAVEVIRSIFPGGTITGCPKVRCMQVIQELEPVPRGLYTGSLGYIGFDGTMDLNIAIRTIVAEGERLSFHVGAGIVADSDPEREYHETLAKAGALLGALQGADAVSQRAQDG